MTLFELVGKIVVNNQEANENVKETVGIASDAGSGISGSFKKIGTAIAGYLAVDKIKDFGLSCVSAAADASAASSQFSQVFGDLEGKAGKSLKKIASEAGISENRMKGSFTKIAAFAKTTGMKTKDALGLSERAMVAVADSAAFYDRSLEDTTESLQSFLKGNYENDAALGLSCTETTRNAAANKLYGKSFKDLSESQKQLTLLQMVEDANKASGALGQAARESDTWTNVTGNLKQSWSDFQAVIGSNVLPLAVDVVKSLAGKVAELTEKLPAMVKWFQKYSGVLANVAVVIGVVVAGVTAYNVVQSVKLAMDAAEVTTLGALIALKLKAAAATLAAVAPYVLIAAAIAAVIAIGVALYKNWDVIKKKCSELASSITKKFSEIKESVTKKINELKDNAVKKFNELKSNAVDKINEMKSNVVNKFSELKTNAVNKFNEIKSGITEKIQDARDAVKKAIDKIKGFFKFEWSLPKIKLPHINISGKFSLDPPSVPKFSIKWYKDAMNNAMILNQPTIFGYNAKSGRYLGAGEAGNEVVAGETHLMNLIGKAVESKTAEQNNRIIELLTALLNALVGGNEELLRALLEGQKFVIGEREFARLVRTYA